VNVVSRKFQLGSSEKSTEIQVISYFTPNFSPGKKIGNKFENFFHNFKKYLKIQARRKMRNFTEKSYFLKRSVLGRSSANSLNQSAASVFVRQLF